MARRKKAKTQERQRDAAVVMFLSLNMILLAFFILLVALSQQDQTRAARLAIEVRRAFQSFGGTFLGVGTQVDQSGVSRERNPLESSQRVEDFLGELTRFVEENEDREALSYEITSEGLIINLSEAFTFEEGSAVIQERSLPLFNNIYNMILRTSNPVRIEGHTDDASRVAGEVADPFRLSAQRALAVFRYFASSGVIPPSRFRVIGYGPNRPIASNLTAEGRALNRRVTIVFVGRLRRIDEGGQ